MPRALPHSSPALLFETHLPHQQQLGLLHAAEAVIGFLCVNFCV